MSTGSISSLIVFLSLVAFAVTSSFAMMLISTAAMLAVWMWHARQKTSKHFQNLAIRNINCSDTDFLKANKTPELLTFLRRQMPRSASKIPLHRENNLFTDLQFDPVAFELDALKDFCKSLGLKYEIDEQNPLWERIETIGDLDAFIASLSPIA